MTPTKLRAAQLRCGNLVLPHDSDARDEVYLMPDPDGIGEAYGALYHVAFDGTNRDPDSGVVVNVRDLRRVLALLRFCAERFGPEGESPSERYDREAADFYRDTGMVAPGKDEPAGIGGTATHDERRAAWNAWADERNSEVRARLRAALGEDGGK